MNKSRKIIQVLEGFKLGSLGVGSKKPALMVSEPTEEPQALSSGKSVSSKAALPPGTKVEVVSGSGLDSGKIGVVIRPAEVPVNGRGVPELEGHYKPPNWKKEVPVRLEDGSIIIMFKNRLKII